MRACLRVTGLQKVSCPHDNGTRIEVLGGRMVYGLGTDREPGPLLATARPSAAAAPTAGGRINNGMIIIIITLRPAGAAAGEWTNAGAAADGVIAGESETERAAWRTRRTEKPRDNAHARRGPPPPPKRSTGRETCCAPTSSYIAHCACPAAGELRRVTTTVTFSRAGRSQRRRTAVIFEIT